jgi:hypothetical protein
VGLGLTRPELAIIPLGLILIWLVIEGLLFAYAMRVADRAQKGGQLPRRSRFRRQREIAAGLGPHGGILAVCPWCNGKGTLDAQLGSHLKLEKHSENEEPDCPRCHGVGYTENPMSARKRAAMRRHLMEQEWRDPSHRS